MVTVLALAEAAPVVCDPAEAGRILADAVVDERRAPVTHPQLVPGLARASGAADAADALTTLCRDGGELAVERGEAWFDAGWSAYALVVSRVEPEGCSLRHEKVALTVGAGPGGIRYALAGALPAERTPVGDCPDPPLWRREQVLEGQDGPVRLVLVTDHEGDRVAAARLVVRRATPGGWTEQVLFDPAPARLFDPDGAGPEVHLARRRDGTPLVVASRDRTTGPCRPVGDQTVWVPQGAGWDAYPGRDAATLLAREGLWRLAGQAGWLLVLAQDDEGDADLVAPRLRRLQKRDPEPLYLLRSADFPELHAGYVLVAPGPWATEAEALAARDRWGRTLSVQVKRAWPAPAACGE